MACKKIIFLVNILLLVVAASLAAPAEKAPVAAEPVERGDQQKEDLSAAEDLKPAASHWGGWGGGWGGHWGGHYGGYYPYYGSYWGGWPSYGYGYGYWPYAGYGGYGGYGYGHHGWW